MKTLMNRTFILSLSIAVLTSTAADAVPIQGTLTINGGAVFNAPISTATRITDFQAVVVQSRDGDFASFVTAGDPVSMAEPFIFNPSTAYPMFYSVGGFNFDLTSTNIPLQSPMFLLIEGIGTVSGNGFSPTPGNFAFSTQGSPANGVFSFSASTGTRVPEGGLTLALLGLSVIGIESMRRRLRPV